jgi:hypothetical protein
LKNISAAKVRVCSVLNTDVTDLSIVEIRPCHSGWAEGRPFVYIHRILYSPGWIRFFGRGLFTQTTRSTVDKEFGSRAEAGNNNRR